MESYFYQYQSPLGKIFLTSDKVYLTGLWFADQKTHVVKLDKNAKYQLLPVFKTTIKWLDLYFAKKIPDFTPQINLNNNSYSQYRKLVWKLLLAIPYGKTSTYLAIANKVATHTKTLPCCQATGNAIKNNPISIIIPCHRVIGTNGKLTGYAGGISRKLALLQLENAFK